MISEYLSQTLENFRDGQRNGTQVNETDFTRPLPGQNGTGTQNRFFERNGTGTQSEGTRERLRSRVP